MTQAPIGQRFSLTYLDRGQPMPDSDRFRRRTTRYFEDHVAQYTGDKVAALIEREAGVDVPTGYDSYLWSEFLEKCDVRDLLDTITFTWQALGAREGGSRDAGQWHAFVKRAVEEENLGYTIDAKCGVHFSVDREFSFAQGAAIKGLGDTRYGAVRHAFQECTKAMDSPAPDTLKAVRSIYDAQETLFKLMTDLSRLGDTEIEKALTPKLEAFYSNAALNATKQWVQSWRKWVIALQHYRHADGVEEPAPPPIELAVALISAGTAQLRWLLDFDTRLRRQ